MLKKLSLIFIALSSFSTLAVNMCTPPEQLVFRWENRNVWVCDTQMETYTYKMTSCNYSGALHKGTIPSNHNVIGYLPSSKYVTRNETYYGTQSCPSFKNISEQELYSYVDPYGSTRTGWVTYSGLLNLISSNVTTHTGEREVEVNCRWENQLVKVSYCEDLR